MNGKTVLEHSPLLQTACAEGVFGERVCYPGGSVENALFTFLSGRPDPTFFKTHPELFFDTYLVCRSADWENFLLELPCRKHHAERRIMRPQRRFTIPRLPELPEGYEVCPFDAAAFNAHPFGHGENYRNAEDFAAHGAGAVVRYRGDIVSAASSFLSLGNEVELDVSTLEAHTRKGLASHCIGTMLADCEARGIRVHWDAQNDISARLAEKFGFGLEQIYTVTILEKEEERDK